MYGDYVPQRYQGAERLPASCPVTTENPECNVRQWDTAQGPVLIELRGAELLVLEGVTDVVTQRASATLF